MATDSPTPQFDLQAFALALVQPLCDEPAQAIVTQTGGETACQVTVSPDDYTRISSSRGRTVRSLGTVLGAAASARLGTRCTLDLQAGQ